MREHRPALRCLGLGLGLGLGALGCSKAGDAAKPSASAPSASSALGASSQKGAPVSAKPGCRAMGVTGRATVDGAPISVNALLDGEHWVELDAGATISLRHTQTTREFKLIGPASVLPCRAGSEQLLLAKGRLSTSANLGVRPGAEVLIATPQGIVRYGDAALDVECVDQGLRVRVKQGEAWVEPEAQGAPPFENPVRSGEVRLAVRHTPARDLLAQCQAAAAVAARSAAQVLEPDAGASSLGERAAAHMRDRGEARVACAIAAAAAFAAPNSDAQERERSRAAVAQADKLWQSVPRAISGRKN